MCHRFPNIFFDIQRSKSVLHSLASKIVLLPIINGLENKLYSHPGYYPSFLWKCGERGGSVVECRTPEREVRGSRPTAAVLCPWARHFTPRKYWLITQEAMAPSRYDWKIVDWDVKPQHNQPTLKMQRWCQCSRTQQFFSIDVWRLMNLLHTVLSLIPWNHKDIQFC